MTLDVEVMAVRTAATLADAPDLVCVRVGGADAHEALDRISPRDLFVRPGQMLHTLVLDDEARPVADLYIACDEDDYLLVADGIAAAALVEHVRRGAAGLDVAVEDLSARRGFLTLNGPYAWEALAAVSTPDVIGLPYLGFFHADRFTCFRAGRTGEYGYDLLVDRDALDAVRASFTAVGEQFGLATVGQPALDRCALESWFFNPRRDARPGLTPVELQLQWRVTYGRAFPGADALAARRRDATRRAVLIASDGELADGAPVLVDREPVGEVIHAGRSPTRGDSLALAVLAREVAHTGVAVEVGATSARVISAPAINNRSLYVDPQRHSYATRDRDRFPPLVRS